jgi:hypothetical protein
VRHATTMCIVVRSEAMGLAHATLPVAADGTITDFTAPVAISASPPVVHNDPIQAPTAT